MNSKVRFALGFILGGVFVISGILKVMAPGRFFQDIENYDLVPWRAASVALAFYLPWLEIVSGIAVIVRPVRTVALVVLSALLLIFSAALLQAWMRGLDISCGCFGGHTGHPRYLLWIGRDVGLLAVSLVLAVLEQKERRRGPSAA